LFLDMTASANIAWNDSQLYLPLQENNKKKKNNEKGKIMKKEL